MAVPARYIRTAGGKVLDVLDRAGLRGLATGTVAAVLAELYVDLRVLRPFQVGCPCPSCRPTPGSSSTCNDEAIRVFLSELADDAGYRIDWPAVPPAALTAAGATGDHDPLRAVLEGAVQHTDPTGGAARAGNAARSMPWPIRSARSPTSSSRPPHAAEPGRIDPAAVVRRRPRRAAPRSGRCQSGIPQVSGAWCPPPRGLCCAGPG